MSMNTDGLQLAKEIDVAMRRQEGTLVIKNLKIFNVFTQEVMEGDIAIEGEKIVGIGRYNGRENGSNVIDGEGKIAIPGLIDGHIHLESAMVHPREFARAVVRHGTTTVITDPHEIANVAGEEGIKYMLDATKDLPIKVFFMLPSCVPATPFDESGAVLNQEELAPFYEDNRVLGLAELMNYVGTVAGDEIVLDKVVDARKRGKLVDGHAPELSGDALNAYVCAGARSDHECSSFQEARQKISLGQWVMIREGTAAKNLKALLGLFDAPYNQRCMLATDDRHPGDLFREGHIDFIIKEAIALGADVRTAIIMATKNAATYFGLEGYGAIAPGYFADIVLLDDLEHFNVEMVINHGKPVYSIGSDQISDQISDHRLDHRLNHRSEGVAKALENRQQWKRVYNSVNIRPVAVEQLDCKIVDQKVRAIGLVAHELYTKNLSILLSEDAVTSKEAFQREMDEKDLTYLSVVERHKATGHIGNAYLSGYGLKRGAIASSVAHDSHNIIVAGKQKEDMVLAIECIAKMNGGLCITCDGEVLCELPLPIGGLMSEESVVVVDKKLSKLKEIAKNLGVYDTIDPFMTLAFVSLPVIPELRLTSPGLVEV